MGNFTNPIVTRTGVNQFWYNHWYSANNYSSILSQDKLITMFINFYIKYGASFARSPFFHSYWYKKKAGLVNYNHALNRLQFFRRQYYSNTVLNIEHSYLVRYTTGEYFPLRLWLLRYNSWLVISLSWYKPSKGKNSNLLYSSSGEAYLAYSGGMGKDRTRNRLNLQYANQLYNQVRGNSQYHF